MKVAEVLFTYIARKKAFPRLRDLAFNLAAFYGVLFPESEEAAFSNYRLWESVGFIIAFAYTSYIRAAIHFLR